MKSAVSAAMLGVMAIGLAGCGSTMSNWLERDTPTQTATVSRDLTMPPDMRLPPPGSAPEAPASTAYAANEPDIYSGDGALSDGSTAAAQPVAPAPRANAAENVYTQAGISLTKPDGTRKTEQELRDELRQVQIAKKRQKNENYGTVFNMGNIFKDE